MVLHIVARLSGTPDKNIVHYLNYMVYLVGIYLICETIERTKGINDKNDNKK